MSVSTRPPLAVMLHSSPTFPEKGPPVMTFVLAPLEPVGLEIACSQERFPVARTYCIGRNYADHTIEMGGNPDREEPFFLQTRHGDRSRRRRPALLQHDRKPSPRGRTGRRAPHPEPPLAPMTLPATSSGTPWALISPGAISRTSPRKRADLGTWPSFDASGRVGTLVPVAQSGHGEDAAIALSVDGDGRSIACSPSQSACSRIAELLLLIHKGRGSTAEWTRGQRAL